MPHVPDRKPAAEMLSKKLRDAQEGYVNFSFVVPVTGPDFLALHSVTRSTTLAMPTIIHGMTKMIET